MTDSEKLKIAKDAMNRVVELLPTYDGLVNKIIKETFVKIEKGGDAKVTDEFPKSTHPVREGGREGDWDSIRSVAQDGSWDGSVAKTLLRLKARVDELEKWPDKTTKWAGRTVEMHEAVEDLGDSITNISKKIDEIEKESGIKHVESIAELHKRVDELKKRFDAHLPKFNDIIGLYAENLESSEGKLIMPEMLDDRKGDKPELPGSEKWVQAFSHYILKGHDCPEIDEPEPPEHGKPDSPQPGDLVWWEDGKRNWQVSMGREMPFNRLVQQDEVRELRIAKKALKKIQEQISEPERILWAFIQETFNEIGDRVTIERRTE